MNGLADAAQQRRLLLGECPRRHINHLSARLYVPI
jgi:hypothetical protein